MCITESEVAHTRYSAAILALFLWRALSLDPRSRVGFQSSLVLPGWHCTISQMCYTCTGHLRWIKLPGSALCFESTHTNHSFFFLVGCWQVLIGNSFIIHSFSVFFPFSLNTLLQFKSHSPLHMWEQYLLRRLSDTSGSIKIHLFECLCIFSPLKQGNCLIVSDINLRAKRSSPLTQPPG